VSDHQTSAPSTKVALLADRSVIGVRGPDAEKLLQGTITNDMELLSSHQPALHAALLTPQGKILFDFFVVRNDGGYLLETAMDQAAGLVRRLAMYRLRARVVIEQADGWAVLVRWGNSPPASDDDAITFADPRLAQLGWRVLQPGPAVALTNATAEEYQAHRIEFGVPEGGKDYLLGDTFPHEADLDQLSGVSFTKGCFVGQEVVSRMQHRGLARKRVVPIEGKAPLTPGAEVKAGSAAIGTVGSVAASSALALVRLDRAAEAAAKGQRLLAGDVEIALRKPSWATFDLAAAASTGGP
jgi:hypothetical protein